MSLISQDHWLLMVGWMLLGAASICLCALTPLPALVHLPPFPGGTTWALVCGGAGSGGGGGCLLLGWWQSRRAARSAAGSAEQQTPDGQVAGVGTPKTSADRLSEEDCVQVPLWFLRTLQEHLQAGRLDAARLLLAEWFPVSSGISPLRQLNARGRCPVCGHRDYTACLLRCAVCSCLVHSQCALLVYQAEAESTECTRRLFCQHCLHAYQQQGWKLTRKNNGWLFSQG